ncbi:MAG: hydrolase [Gammaproteobacteria bacterium]|nr:hydrolase [Gammaproteobacteria bacterium]
MIGKLGNTALQGIQRSTQGMARSAVEIARASQPGDQQNMTRALVELKQHEHAAKANIKTLAVADRLLGSLLDVKA